MASDKSNQTYNANVCVSYMGKGFGKMLDMSGITSFIANEGKKLDIEILFFISHEIFRMN